MPEEFRRPPTGYVAKCRCGALVGAVDATRTPREEAGRILGVWLYEGNMIIPKFGDRWEAELSTCKCDVMFAPIPPELFTPKCNVTCLKCGGDSEAIDFNSGNIPGIGYEEETKYRCRACSYEWWN